MTRRGGRFINIGSKQFSIKEIEKMAESAEYDAIEFAVTSRAELIRDALNDLLEEMADKQADRRPYDADLDFSNYSAEIMPAKTKVVRGKRRIISVNVQVVNQNGSDFNLFNLLDAGAPRRQAKDPEVPMKFPVYSGALVNEGSRTTPISIGKVEVDYNNWVTKYDVEPIKPRNLYSRVRNQLTSDFKKVEQLARKPDGFQEFIELEKENNELNFQSPILRETDRKVLSFRGLLTKDARVSVKLRGG